MNGQISKLRLTLYFNELNKKGHQFRLMAFFYGDGLERLLLTQVVKLF